MSSPRLTKDQKSAITNKVLNKTFTDRQAALTEGFKKLGDDIYDALYRDQQQVLSRVPKNFLSLNTTLQRLCEVKEQLNKDRELLKKHLNSLFYSVNTRKQALAAWPECEPFLPADVPVVKNLPALPTHDLNALIARMSGGA